MCYHRPQPQPKLVSIQTRSGDLVFSSSQKKVERPPQEHRPRPLMAVYAPKPSPVRVPPRGERLLVRVILTVIGLLFGMVVYGAFFQ